MDRGRMNDLGRCCLLAELDSAGLRLPCLRCDIDGEGPQIQLVRCRGQLYNQHFFGRSARCRTLLDEHGRQVGWEREIRQSRPRGSGRVEVEGPSIFQGRSGRGAAGDNKDLSDVWQTNHISNNDCRSGGPAGGRGRSPRRRGMRPQLGPRCLSWDPKTHAMHIRFLGEVRSAAEHEHARGIRRGTCGALHIRRPSNCSEQSPLVANFGVQRVSETNEFRLVTKHVEACSSPIL
mmetsp:Transcript_37237/g.119974  ORF Transcript_37237/g.119974 Transcript_37237/m.119974 type:complete len:234 (-) Transcript_37237:1407-2108(-)